MQAGGRWGGREAWDEEMNEREVSEASQARDCGRRSDVRAGRTTYGCCEVSDEEVGM